MTILGSRNLKITYCHLSLLSHSLCRLSLLCLSLSSLAFCRTSQRAFMFITMRDVISAATRLNLVGSLGATVLQHHIAPISDAILNQWKDIPVEEACQTVPLLDIVQGCHSYLFSRPFCS
ncbi:hypothetical protein RchiOBHm_Chr1g0322441 [Rosa chinensis]|uniref:Uncharacterized protein n=1 Tax=Rosa chinensis TaxID=74649 RepID=A0A2P6S992_ROSCH|nr:hypothetical protein RchiOBHm_Chr1g0322441 [Rosa chinensis]